ncbi:MAG: hypothetical protein RR144_05475 [Clostridia bacterium]
MSNQKNYKVILKFKNGFKYYYFKIISNGEYVELKENDAKNFINYFIIEATKIGHNIEFGDVQYVNQNKIVPNYKNLNSDINISAFKIAFAYYICK